MIKLSDKENDQLIDRVIQKDEIGISLKELYDQFGGQLKHGQIIKDVDGSWEYYDLQTDRGTVCVDGETCKVIEINDFGYKLLNLDGESYMTFILTEEEFRIGVF